MLKLTKEDEDYIRENLRYDPETGELWWTKLAEVKYNKRRMDKPVGSNVGKGYLEVRIPLPSGSRNILSHRICWFLYCGSWPEGLLDHINGIKDDNKIENLRKATQNQNEMNKKKRADCSSKYKGVSWNKRNQQWRARVRKNELGSYTSEEEAARAYDKAARELFGEYACLNFPEEHEQGAMHGHDL